MLASETVWVIAGSGQLAGTYVGPDEIFDLWKQIAAQTGGGLKIDVKDVLANDERAVVLVTARGERDGHHLDESQVAIFELSDGKVSNATFIYEDAAAYDQFWED
jgi:hypothetical protein